MLNQIRGPSVELMHEELLHLALVVNNNSDSLEKDVGVDLTLLAPAGKLLSPHSHIDNPVTPLHLDACEWHPKQFCRCSSSNFESVITVDVRSGNYSG